MILTLWALGACTGLGPGSDGISTRVEELWVEPADLTLTVREGEPQELQFTAFARQSLDDDPRPIRLRLYRFAMDGERIRLDQYRFNDEAPWRGRWRKVQQARHQ